MMKIDEVPVDSEVKVIDGDYIRSAKVLGKINTENMIVIKYFDNRITCLVGPDKISTIIK